RQLTASLLSYRPKARALSARIRAIAADISRQQPMSLSQSLPDANLGAAFEDDVDRRVAAHIGGDPALRGSVAEIGRAGHEAAEAHAKAPRPLPGIEHRAERLFALYGACDQHVRVRDFVERGRCPRGSRFFDQPAKCMRRP